MKRFPDRTAQRRVPSVAGIDLEQSLNYLSADDLPLEWFYRSYTHKQIFYQPGSRPGLEAFLQRHRISRQGKPTLEKIREIAAAVYEQVQHYSLVGRSGPGDRGFTEEELILSGEGWCNEQARVFCLLAQIVGCPARLVYAAMPEKRGHVLVEIWHGNRWNLVDQTAAYLFHAGDEKTFCNVYDLKHDEGVKASAGKAYLKVLRAERRKAPDKILWDRVVPYGHSGKNPLRLFHSVGYCNYFAH